MSNASTHEFPANKANCFKNRLPQPLLLNENSWKVGLAGVTYPTPPLQPHHTPTFEPDDLICRFRWSMRTLTKDWEGSTVIVRPRQELSIRGQDLIDDRFLVFSGKSLMQYIVYRLRRKLTVMQNDQGESLRAPDKKKFYPVFRWEGDQLLIDNTENFLNQSGDRKRPEVLFGRKLVETMNWIGQDKYGNYQLLGSLLISYRGTGRKATVTMLGVPSGSTPTKDCNSVPTAIGDSSIWTNLTRRRLEGACPTRLGVPCTYTQMWDEA